MGGRKLRGWCGFVGLALGFLVGRFFGRLVFAAGILLSFFPFLVPFCLPLVYFWKACSLLLNILLILIKKKKKKQFHRLSSVVKTLHISSKLMVAQPINDPQ